MVQDEEQMSTKEAVNEARAHAAGRIEIHRNCDIRHSRLPVRQEWRIA